MTDEPPFDPAAFVAEVESLGVELEARVWPDGTGEIKRTFMGLPSIVDRSKAEALFEKLNTSQANLNAVVGFLMERQQRMGG